MSNGFQENDIQKKITDLKLECMMGKDSTILGEIPANEILAKIANGKPINYKNVIINGNLNIRSLNLTRENDKIPIRSQIEITNCVITGEVDFSGSLFIGTVNFGRSEFKLEPNFGVCVFSGYAIFVGSKFHEDAYFGSSLFEAKADFAYSHFFKNALFGSWFEDGCEFSDSKFDGRANFGYSTFKGRTEFGDSLFKGVAFFKGATFNGKSDFSKSQFSKKAIFKGSYFKQDVNFMDSKFSGHLLFYETQFDKLANLRRSNFDKKSKFFLQMIDFDTIYIDWDSIKSIYKKFDDKIYLSLIENYKARGFFEDADDCYYLYRNKRRSGLSNPYYVADWILMALYGYGVKPLRPLGGLLILLVASSLLYSYFGVAGNAADDAFNTSLILTLSGTKLIDSPYHPATWMLFWLFTIEKSSASLLFALFLVSIGKTLIR